MPAGMETLASVYRDRSFAQERTSVDHNMMHRWLWSHDFRSAVKGPVVTPVARSLNQDVELEALEMMTALVRVGVVAQDSSTVGGYLVAEGHALTGIVPQICELEIRADLATVDVALALNKEARLIDFGVVHEYEGLG